MHMNSRLHQHILEHRIYKYHTHINRQVKRKKIRMKKGRKDEGRTGKSEEGREGRREEG